MKINEFTKSQQLLIFIDNIEKFGNRFSLGEYGDLAINCGIATSKKNLSSILSNLKKEQWIMNHANGYWQLTPLGMHYVDNLLLKLDDNSWFFVQPKENKKVEQSNETEVDCASLANMFADAAKRFTQQPKKNKKVEQPNSFENDDMNNAANNMKNAFESMAKSFEVMKKSFETLNKTSNNANNLDRIQPYVEAIDHNITYLVTHFDTVYNAVKNGSESPNKIIERMNEIYEGGINLLIHNNNALKKVISEN